MDRMWYEKYIGKKYEWASVGPNSYDCLTLILSIINERYGIKPLLEPIPENWAKVDQTRYLRESLRYGLLIANKDHVNEGQMVLFRLSGDFPEHAGFMVDKNRFIHILDDDFVRVDNLRKHPWKHRFWCAVDFRRKDG